MELQQQYWNQWNSLQRKAMGLDKSPANPWEMGMEHWWSAIKDAVPPSGQSFYRQMMDQGRSFLQMAEQIMQAPGKQDNPTEVWSRLMASLADSFCQSSGLGDSNQCTSFWEMPLDNWNRMVSALSPVPGDILRGMPNGDVKEHLDRMLGAPGLGYTRETQAQYQSLLQAAMDYQQAMADYTLFFNRMGEQSVNALQEKTKSAEIESARQLYDTWVGCCEEVYAKEVMTAEYIELHGRLVNALMLLKSRWGEIMSELYAMYNLPTNDDLRTLQIRMQEQRRENKTLRTQVTKLQRSVDALQSSPAATRQPAPRTKATSVKKKAVAKKATTKPAAPRKQTQK